MNTDKIHSSKNSKYGYVLPLVIVVMVILIMLAGGEMMSAYQARLQAVNAKSQTEAMLAAEAGYEKAIFWMSQQPDILGSLQHGGGEGTLSFGTSSCRYQVGFLNFMGHRPLFRIAVIGTSGRPVFGRSVDVAVVQEVTGWAMGACKIPSGSGTGTTDVYFAPGEIFDMPIHINDQHDNPDNIDIHITGSPAPVFTKKIEMGESRKTSGGSDKYSSSVMSCFHAGIAFDQPYIRITDATAVNSKLARFHDSTNPSYIFTPVANGNLTNTCNGNCNTNSADNGSPGGGLAAVQLEFYVVNGVGKVRITNNCTIQGFKQNNDNKTSNYKITPGSNPISYQRYFVYAYHFSKDPNTVVNITDTYVTQEFGGHQSDPGGQIYVNGNVVIGSDQYTDMIVNGKMTVVATGNIWIADSIKVDGTHDANGLPTADNPNVLGLIARGVVKVADPGMSGYAVGGINGYPGPAPVSVNDFNDSSLKHYYRPVGNGTLNSNNRSLPNPTIVEAALTIGGGGWGAENIQKTYGGTTYGGRKNNHSPTDDLIVRGSISEAIRGIVGQVNNDGYVKKYYMDNRLTQGILPGDIWFSGKYIPAPDGWQDHSVILSSDD